MQTVADYLGGWILQFVDVSGSFPTHDFFFSKESFVFFSYASFFPLTLTGTLPYKKRLKVF